MSVFIPTVAYLLNVHQWRGERDEEEEEVVVVEVEEEEARGAGVGWGGGVLVNSPTTVFSVPFIRHVGQLATTVN